MIARIRETMADWLDELSRWLRWQQRRIELPESSSASALALPCGCEQCRTGLPPIKCVIFERGGREFFTSSRDFGAVSRSKWGQA